MSSGQWLLDFTIGGRVYRYSTSFATVVDAAGRTLEYLAGLADMSVRVESTIEDQGFQVVDHRQSWALLVARGLTFQKAPAVLRYWAGGELERARVVLDGELRDPEYADPLQPGSLVASISRIIGADTTFPVQTKVDATTWLDDDGDHFDHTIQGAFYPVVFGYPGYHESARAGLGDGAFKLIAAVPCLLTRYYYFDPPGPGRSRLLVASGLTEVSRRRAKTGLGSVRVFDANYINILGTEVFEPLDVLEDVDLLGQPYSYVEFAIEHPQDAADVLIGFHPVQPILTTKYVAAFAPNLFDGATPAGGGTLRPEADGPIRNLTDVALFVLRNSGRRVDLKAQAAQRSQLDQYAVDGFINNGVKLVPWFESNLLPLFPIARCYTSEGMFWRYINWWAQPTDAIVNLTVGVGGLRRASSIKTAMDSVVNRFTIDFARSGINNTYTARLIMGPDVGVVDPGLEVDQRITASPRLADSVSRFGLIDADPVQSSFVWSDKQAVAILGYLAQRDAFPHVVVSYTGGELEQLQTGDVVTITDPEVGFDTAVALVQAVTLSGGRLQSVSLEVLHQATRPVG